LRKTDAEKQPEEKQLIGDERLQETTLKTGSAR
jgi:hypothetical protein